MVAPCLGHVLFQPSEGQQAPEWWRLFSFSRPFTCSKRGTDKTIRKCANFDEMKADEYRYWQSRPVHERVARCRNSPRKATN